MVSLIGVAIPSYAGRLTRSGRRLLADLGALL
jgi:hypothetical protein